MSGGLLYRGANVRLPSTVHFVLVFAEDCAVDIIFALDGSASVGYNDFGRMQAFVIFLVAKFDINSGNTRVGLVTYSDGIDVENIIYLSTYVKYLSLLQKRIGQVEYKSGGTTDTHDALYFIRNVMLTERRGDRTNVSNTVVVLTDGQSTSPERTRVSMTVPSVCLSVCHTRDLYHKKAQQS